MDSFNTENATAITAGDVTAKAYSSSDFIVNVSSIHQRYVLEETGILDPKIMHPCLPSRGDDQPSLMAEMARDACLKALAEAGRKAADVDLIICAASNHERAYPAIAVEIQGLLGAHGFAFDMNIACSSATLGMQAAADMIGAGSARCAIVVSPEICSVHLEWRDRNCHFMFGDVCTAAVLEPAEAACGPHFRILSTRCAMQFSNNIRNNDGFLRRAHSQMQDRRDMQFMQEGRRVFKEVLPRVVGHIAMHLEAGGIEPADLKRVWLHQAIKALNDFIGRKVLGRTPTPEEQPNILQHYANTSSAGLIIAFAQHSGDLSLGDLGLICSFGVGYSVGSVLLERG